MTEQVPPASVESKKSRTVLYVVLGIIMLCGLCCASLLIGQYILESSDFSLVYAFQFTA